MSAYLARNELDLESLGERRSLRLPNGIQIEYGNITYAAGVQGGKVSFIRPFVDIARGTASWRFMYEMYGFASLTEMSNEYMNVYAKAENNGISQPRSISYIVIGRWK